MGAGLMMFALCGLFAGGFATYARIRGLLAVAPVLIATIVATGTVLLAMHEARSSQWEWIAAGLLGGSLGGWLVGEIQRQGKARRVFSRLARGVDNPQLLVVVTALALAILITFVFSSLANGDSTTPFWKGFYQSWTAALVAFVFLGLAGVLVTFYSPTKDQFQRRVSNLYDVHDSVAIEHLSKEAQKIGYYAVSIEREYRIEEYDSERNAYKITVTHKTRNKNFLKDVHAPDKARVYVQFDKEDLFDPPLERMGTLLSARIDDVKQFDGVEHFGENGLDKEWSYELRAGHDACVEVVYSCWFRAGMEHSFRGSRFARRIDAWISYCCDSDGEPELLVSASGFTRKDTLSRGKRYSLAHADDYVPGKSAFAFTVMPPK